MWRLLCPRSSPVLSPAGLPPTGLVAPLVTHVQPGETPQKGAGMCFSNDAKVGIMKQLLIIVI